MHTWKPFALTAVVAALCVPASASASFMHVVAPGESLSSVAATDGLSVDQLAAANGLSPSTPLIAGSSLAIPPQTVGVISSTPSSQTGSSSTVSSPTYVSTTSQPASSTGGGYLVQPGDTLSAIAARYGVSVGQLAAANGLSPDGLLVSGTTLSVSGTSEEAGETATGGSTSSGITQYVSTPAVSQTSGSSGTSGAAPQPTAEFVSPSEIGSIAAANGVPPSLAQAIGYQESGFNNNEVSTTGATGVMQIEPGTWNYIGQNLAGPPPLSSTSAADNVRAGSLLLHSLLNQTGGNAAMAAAAYYQGLPSVQAQGLLPSTQQYVNDVMALQQRFSNGGG